jgi:hypothetical protein
VSFLIALGCSLGAAALGLGVMVANAIEGGWDPTSAESLLVVVLAGLGAVLAWCAWGWLRQGRRRHALGGSLGAVAIVFGSAAVVAVGAHEGRRSCDEVRTSAGDFHGAHSEIGSDAPTAAQRLADDFIRCDTLEGLGRREVRKLLGRPDGTGTSSQIDPSAGRYDYYVGPERGGYISIDVEVLAVRFGSDGAVRRVSIDQS